MTFIVISDNDNIRWCPRPLHLENTLVLVDVLVYLGDSLDLFTWRTLLTRLMSSFSSVMTSVSSPAEHSCPGWCPRLPRWWPQSLHLENTLVLVDTLVYLGDDLDLFTWRTLLTRLMSSFISVMTSVSSPAEYSCPGWCPRLPRWWPRPFHLENTLGLVDTLVYLCDDLDLFTWRALLTRLMSSFISLMTSVSSPSEHSCPGWCPRLPRWWPRPLHL
jgi:hypothetical protein